jgi:hypothetical protein
MRVARFSCFLPRSLTSLAEISQSLRGRFRAKFYRFLVPLPRLCNIGLDAHGAKLIEIKRVKCLAEHQRRIGTSRFDSAPQQNPGGGEIAVLKKPTAAAQERVKFIGTERRLDNAAQFCRRRPNLGTGHL